jgi:hypothetical protein
MGVKATASKKGPAQYKDPTMSNEWYREDLPLRGDDPYIIWSLGPGRQYFLAESKSQPLIPTILRLLMPVKEFVDKFPHPQSDLIVQVPSFYLQPPAFLGEQEYITAVVSENFFSARASDEDLLTKVLPLVIGPPLAPETFCPFPEAESPQPPTGAPENGTVVVGVIDDGFAFAHERFRLEDNTTRVEYIWLQDGVCIGRGSPVPYGRECRKRDQGLEKGIDKLLKECTTDGFLDEDKLYRLTGVVDFTRDGHKAVARRAVHGTHVLDLACGFEPSDKRGDRPIVCVQLPWRTTADTSGARLEPFVTDGIRYILARADRIAEQRNCGPLPVVINFSYGIIAGPHDGKSALEDAIDRILAARKGRRSLEIVIPSGNSHLVRAHTEVSLAARPSRPRARGAHSRDAIELAWRVLPDDRTSSFLEVWLPPFPADRTRRIEITITPPGGPASPPLGDEEDGKGWEWKPGNDVLCWVVYQTYLLNQRGRFFVALLPTAFLDAPGDLAPSGVWTVKLQNVSLAKIASVHAWIQRDDTPFGYPIRGRQSYFDEACYVRFDAQGREVEEDPAPPSCHLRRTGLINAIATGNETIVAGGYLRRELRFARYSAGGTPAAAIRSPDAALVSDDSKVLGGVLAAGSRSGSRVAFSGTSVAAPQLARWVADNLAAGNLPDRAAVCAQAQLDEAALPAWKPTLQPQRGGCGRMRRKSAFPRQRLYWE